MCQEVRKICKCGKHSARFHLRDNILSPEVISELYCPQCSQLLDIDPATMVMDNGWVIEYDMDLARFMAISKLTVDAELVQPDYIFDRGYACWLEMYPGEKEDILEERAEIMQLQQRDPGNYLRKITSWNIARIERLKAAGWRKALAA